VDEKSTAIKPKEKDKESAAASSPAAEPKKKGHERSRSSDARMSMGGSAGAPSKKALEAAEWAKKAKAARAAAAPKVEAARRATAAATKRATVDVAAGSAAAAAAAAAGDKGDKESKKKLLAPAPVVADPEEDAKRRAHADAELRSRSQQLVLAAETGNSVRIKDLISLNTDLEARSAVVPHNTALLAACHRGHVDAVKLLLTAGADIEVCVLVLSSFALVALHRSSVVC
jgi:hypothetical protein